MLQPVSTVSDSQKRCVTLLAIVLGVSGVVRITKLEAKLTGSDKIVPALRLLIRLVVPAGHPSRVHETAKRVAGQICPVRIELATTVIRGEIERGLVEQADNLNVCSRLHELRGISGPI